jgi:hypothetical protein
MTYFVEYQRAMRALRVVGIILGVLLLIAVIGRLSSHVHGIDAMLSNIESSPTAHVTHQTLADGTQRTVVDDPVKKIHAVALMQGRHVHLEISEPSKGRADTDNIAGGGLSIIETNKGGVDRVVINTERGIQIPFGILFATSIIMGFIVASLLGGVLSKENDGHLELAWTKPVSRESYALAAFGIDIATIVVAQFLWVGVALLCMLLFFVPGVTFEANAGLHIAITLLGSIAWYAALTGWSASIKRGPGIVIGLGWLFGSIVPGVAEGLRNSTIPLIAFIHAVFVGLSYVDPLAYVSLHITNSAMSGTTIGALQLTIATSCAGLVALIVFYLAVAVAQWRRVEA